MFSDSHLQAIQSVPTIVATNASLHRLADKMNDKDLNQSKILEFQKLFSGYSLSSADEKAALEAVDDTIFAGFMRSQGLENLDEESSKKLKMFFGDFTLFKSGHFNESNHEPVLRVCSEFPDEDSN
jgi:hypothetical protein